MKHLDSSTWYCYHDDKLVKRWRNLQTRQTLSQGKRVSQDCPLNKDEIRAYVTKGAVTAVVKIRNERKFDLHNAKALLDTARGNPFHH